MYCSQCGAQMDQGSRFCPNCGAPVGQTTNQGGYYYNQPNQQGGYNPYQQPFSISPEVEKSMTTLLVLSGIELACCNQLFGALGLIFAILAKSALSRGDFEKYEKNSKIAKYVLIAGVIFAVLCGLIYNLFVLATVF